MKFYLALVAGAIALCGCGHLYNRSSVTMYNFRCIEGGLTMYTLDSHSTDGQKTTDFGTAVSTSSGNATTSKAAGTEAAK